MIALNERRRISCVQVGDWHTDRPIAPPDEAIANDHGQYDDLEPIVGIEAITAKIAADEARIIAETRGKESWLTIERRGYKYLRVGTQESFCSLRAVARRVRELTGIYHTPENIRHYIINKKPIGGFLFKATERE